jgi:propanol-preferring alcohol dehydrogenase
MAEYMTASARSLVPLGDAVDPVAAAPLADAGLTPYHAIKRAMPYLAGGGRSALVIGLGGLGLIGVQVLTALTGARVIATDLRADACAEAERHGALTVSGATDLVQRIRELNHGQRVDAVFDFVGIDSTLALAVSCVEQCGSLTVLGIGGGSFTWSYLKVPYEVNFASTYWGSLEELHEVVAMYREGRITTTIERFRLDDALEAYRKLRDGELTARAVVVPHGE